MGDLDARLLTVEARAASFSELEAQGIQASLDYIQENVAPQLVTLKTSIDLAQAQIDQIIIGGKAPDTLKFGGKEPSFYATAQALSEGLAEKVPNTRKVNGKALSGDIELGKGDVGLGNVNNTADKDKPVSEAQQLALEAVAQAAATSASTKASRRNRHLNPGFQVSQERAAGTVVDVSSPMYIFDGVTFGATGGGTVSCLKSGKRTPGGSPFRARGVVSVADAALAAADIYNFNFPIEGVDVADFEFGTANARPFTWRAVVNLPAGNWGVSFCNQAATRSYVKMFTVLPAEAGNDKLISLTVPGDTVGTWIKDETGVGVWCRLAVAFGSNFVAAQEGIWSAGNFCGTAAQTNGIAERLNAFEVADIGFYMGSVLPEWELPEYKDVLRACRRLYRVVGANVYSTGHGSYGGCIVNFDVSDMRGAPSIQAFAQNNFGGFPGAQAGLNIQNSQKRVWLSPNGQAPADSGAELIAIVNSRL
ncbi:hypothetical protein ACSV5S_12835 [Agrobacterium deltaense]|uniref:hypothetical protein n=1 Tax=Agrobacterium deltaense TaxID=1183412 RepID=UPI003FCFA3C7